MPIRAYLGGLQFDSETTRLMAIAFEMALVALQRTDGIVNPTREAVAKRSSSLRKLVSATRSVYATRPCSRCGQAPSDNQRPQSSSASRFTAQDTSFAFCGSIATARLIIPRGDSAEAVGDLTAGTMRGPTRLTRRGSIPGRAARGSISPRKATCQVPASGSSSFGPRSPARAKDPDRERPRLLGTRASRVLGAEGVLP